MFVRLMACHVRLLIVMSFVIKTNISWRYAALARPFALSRKREIIFFKKIWSKVGVRLICMCALHMCEYGIRKYYCSEHVFRKSNQIEA